MSHELVRNRDARRSRLHTALLRHSRTAVAELNVRRAAFSMKLDNDSEMFEYACHEGNTAIRYIEPSRFELAKKK